jgi:hypothetical protein
MDEGTLYDEAKPDLQAVSGPLFEFAEQQVQKRGAFLPFGATLEPDGVALKAAATETEVASSDEVLPLLHEGLRSSLTSDTRAVAVCEWVKITPTGGDQTDAVKVLVEHANGLCVAFYRPMRKKLLGKWQVGDMLVVAADPEVGAW